MTGILDNPIESVRSGLHCVLLALLLTAAPLVLAAPNDITDAEIALLPKYCPSTIWFKERYRHTDPAHWMTLMGPGFTSMHHFCWALIYLRRAEKATLSPQARQGLREAALGDFDYVIQTVPPDFVMLPEVYTKAGQTQLQLKRPNRAGDAFAKARSLKPDYWPAYFHWAEYLRSIDKTAEARTLVSEGLTHSPQAQPLQQLLKTLDGSPRSGGAKATSPSAGQLPAK